MVMLVVTHQILSETVTLNEGKYIKEYLKFECESPSAVTILSKAIQAISLAASSTYSNQYLQRERSI